MQTPLQIRQRILRVLEAVSPWAMPAEALRDGVNHSLPEPLTVADLGEHLSWLLTHRLVDKVAADALDPDAASWVITKAGLGALRQ